MRAASLILLWCAVICGGAGVFFAFQVWDLRFTAGTDFVALVASIVLMVLGGMALLALVTLHGLASALVESDRS